MNRVENFLFVKNNRTAKDENAAKKVVSLKDPAIEAFFYKENILQMKSLLGTMLLQQAAFREAQKNDTPLYDIDNGCFNQPMMKSQHIERYAEVEVVARLQKMFPTPEVQDRIIATRSQILVKALVWWAKNIRQRWEMSFGKSPEFFSEKLALHL